MDVLVQATVFNAELVGRAVAVKGIASNYEEINGTFLVSSIGMYAVQLLAHDGKKVTVHIKDVIRGRTVVEVLG